MYEQKNNQLQAASYGKLLMAISYAWLLYFVRISRVPNVKCGKTLRLSNLLWFLNNRDSNGMPNKTQKEINVTYTIKLWEYTAQQIF